MLPEMRSQGIQDTGSSQTETKWARIGVGNKTGSGSTSSSGHLEHWTSHQLGRLNSHIPKLKLQNSAILHHVSSISTILCPGMTTDYSYIVFVKVAASLCEIVVRAAYEICCMGKYFVNIFHFHSLHQKQDVLFWSNSNNKEGLTTSFNVGC